MSSPLIGAKVFEINSEAQQLHEYGLRTELSGGYTQAHESFAAAQQVLAGLPESVDVSVQWGRILRDDGFTYVRSAIQTPDIADLDKADEVIEEASGKTFLQILKAGNTSPSPEPPLRLNRLQWRELLAEHGATISLLGRIATVKEVLFGQRDENNPQETTYETAHHFLKQGNNGYYRVSNTMVAARQERINGNMPKVVGWLGRAATGLAWTAAFDRENVKPAVRTFGSRLLQLRNHLKTVHSVAGKP